MKLIKAGTSGLSAQGLIAKAGHVEEQMTGNPAFATPNPTIAELTAARVALVEAVAQAEDRAPASIAVRNERAVVLRTFITNMARYVNNVCEGDVEKALSSGFELAKKPEPSTRLAAPAGVKATAGAYEGSVDLAWERVAHARMYEVQQASAISDNATWTPVLVSSKARVRISGLEPGKVYAFRVVALGRIGQGPASEAVQRRAA